MDTLAKLGFVVMGIALVVAGFAAIFYYGDGRLAGDGESLKVMLIALGIGVLPLPLQAKRDAAATAMFAVVFALIGMLPGLITLLMGQASALPLTGVCSVIFGGGVAFLLKSQYGKEKLPNPLAEQFGQNALLEYEGVQFVAIAPQSVAAGEPFAIEVHVQNCWNGPRAFGFELKPHAGMKLHATPMVQLAALEVGVMTVPFVAPVNSGPFEVQGNPAVTGSGGARLRTRRGHIVERKVSTGMQVAALAAGHLVWGGGLSFNLQATGDAPTAPAQLADVQWKSVWPTAEARLEPA